MFLLDPTFGNSFEKCETEIRRLMGRADAELLFCRKWDERRLAYRIRGRKRGVYVLTYFRAAPDKITPLERDAELSENILRLLVLRADGVTPEHMESMVRGRGEELPQVAGEKEPPPTPEAGPGETAKVTIERAEEPEPVTTETPAGDPSPGEAIPESD
jgi:small subunit ribosomal protein S6